MRVIVNAKRLRVLRAEAGLTQQGLADGAGINRAVISRVEREEKRDIRVSNLYLLAKAFSRICERHIPMEELVLEVPDVAKPQQTA